MTTTSTIMAHLTTWRWRGWPDDARHGGLTHYHNEDPLTQTQGQNILRSKGILALKGNDQRFVIQGATHAARRQAQRSPGSPTSGPTWS